MKREMSKRITSLFLSLIMLLQIFIPQNIFAEGDKSLPQDKYVKVGMIDGKSYDAKIMNELNRIAAKNRKSSPGKPGVRLFSKGPYFGDNNEPKDEDKPKYFGNVSAKLDLKGLDGKAFQWNEIFGVDESGNPKPAQIIFRQMDAESSTDTGLYYMLQITKEGKYTWSDGEGKPTKLPLFSKSLKPYKYEVRIDERVSDKVKLLTEVIFGTEGSSPTFSPENADGEIIANITLGLTYQQIASTKFKSEWHTDVVEADRPGMKANFAFDDEGDGLSPVSVELPKNDKDTKIIRDWYNEFDPDLVISYYLEKTPVVTIDDTTDGLKFDTTNKTVTSGDHKFKYDFTYDVINGGKLTMTEILLVTFDANGGKFASITEPNAEQKIVKEVEYEGTLTDKAENPTRPGKAFKGWATEADGTTPATDSDYENLKTAKTFYAIWSDEDIQVEELKTTESRITFRKNGTQNIINDFVPTFEQLKSQVKVKDASGNFAQLPETGVTFSIVDDEGKEYTEDSVDLKKFIYDKVKENNADEVSRTETVKAKIKYDDGTTREIEIPIVVLKNIYRGSDQGNRLPHIPDDYVKVTIDPTDKAQDPQKTYYYVNPKAKVVVPVKDPVGSGDNKFSKWTMKADSATGDGADYTKTDRHQFTEASTITAQYGTGAIKIQYVDQNGDEIDAKYKIAGQDYPSDKSGGLAKEADELQFASKGPDFEGYIYGSRDSIKGKRYKDSADPDNLDIVTYKYYKKVTTDTPKNPNVYFPVIFDANEGEFESDHKDKKTVYVYFDGNDATVEKVTFKEVLDEFEKVYSNPTKDGFDFKEWQNAKTNGTKPADNYEIKFKGWNWDADPVNGYVPETFYAHYAKASALISYLDLDGKPIADDFKIDGVEYPTEKDGKLDEAIASDVFTADTAPKLIGYKFNRIELNPANSKYALDNKATIKIYYEKLPDVIPKTDDSKKPDGYVEVKFVPTKKATETTEKIFYVNPKKEVTIPIADPEAKATYTFKEWKMGAKADGAVYTPSTAQKFTEATTVITATYEETENIIPYDPSVPDPMVRPEGYVRVTFAADPGLKLTESKAYYVKKNAGIKLGNAELVKPAYKEETGYKFKEWDQEDTLKIEATDILVTAKATKLENVIPEKTGETQNEKPEGYKEVTFVIKTEDKDKGSITGVAKFFVNPTEYVTITPPTTKAETGYKFGAWDKNATIPTVYEEDTTITGSFNELRDVIPKTRDDESEKPAGYVTVTFTLQQKFDKDAGKFVEGETTVYYVKPNKDVTIDPPKTSAYVGYKFSSWSPDTTKARMYTMPNTDVLGSFEKIGDFIPSTDKDGKPNPKPEGYVTVIFTDGKYGTITSGKKVYYVNPNANVKMSDLTFARNANRPVVTPDVGYKFNAWLNEKSFVIKDDFEIKEDLLATAEYNPLNDVIPKDKPTGGENDKPKGYITVTFKTTDKAGSVEKVVYVNPEKAVALDSYAPEVNPITGYEFADWDRPIKEKIQYDNGDVITAQFNAKDDVIPQEKTDGSDKPAGYLTVTFDKGDHGKELTGKTVYYVKPNKKVTVPAPDVKPSVGYEFEKWDKELTQTFAEDTKITAQYKERDNIIPQGKPDGSDRPDGYFTVTFKADANGSLSGKTVYYVKPNVEIDLTNTAKAIAKNPNVGYTADGGKWSPAIVSKKYTADETYTFNFKALKDVIEVKPGVDKPNGYVTVKVVPTDKATDKTEKIYYVNPTKEVTIPFVKPTGKAVSVDASNPKAFTWNFTKWTSDEVPFRTWTDEIKAKFTDDTTVTANYEKSITDQGTVIADEITVHESFKDGSGNWVNNFIDTEATVDQLKATLKVNGSALPDGATVTFLDDSGNAIEGDALKNVLYAKLQEKNEGNKPSRTETLKAKVKFKNGEVQNVEIPIKVIKNIYKANTDASKPSYVPDGYVKVTVDPTMKAKDPQKYTYYVNPAAKVVIPGEDPEGTGDNKFVKWTIGDTEYKLSERHQFNGETTITAQYVSDVIPQDGPTKPDTVPEGFVEVKFVPTNKATDTTEKIYWVNPEKEVTIPVKDPVGKQYFTFKEWKIGDVNTGETYKVGTPKQFTDKNGTTITATYTEAKNIIPYDPDEPITKPEGYVRVTFKADPGLKLTERKAYYVKKNAGITLGNAELVKPNYTEDTGYKFNEWDPKDDTIIVATDIVVTAKATELAPVIPEKDDKGNSNDKPEGYVTVTFDKGAHGALEGKTVYYVNPKVAVVLEGVAPKVHPNAGYESAGWDISINQAIQYTVDTTITALYNNPSDISTKEIDGYVKVEFKPGEHGSLSGPTTYWVKPGAEVYLPSPTVKADDGYRFDKWDRSLKVKFEANAPTYVITAQYEKQKPVDPTPDLRPYPVPGDCNNTCDQPNAPNQPNQPNQPNVGKDALNTTDHYQYLIGYPDGNFAPNKGMTRAEAATMFTRLLRERPIKWRHYNAGLSDIRPGDWYANTVGYAVQRGIVSGYPDGSFKPNKPITRAEFAAIASRFDALAQGNAISFSDLAPSHWGYNAIRSAATKGWISGYPDNTFRPEQAITRAEVTAITNRMLNRHADLYWIDAHPSEVIRFGDVKRSDWYFEPIMEATMGHDFIRDRDKKTEHWTGINGKSFI